MTKNELMKYLRDHELDVQSGRASFLMCFLAYEAYLGLYKKYHKDFGPWFSKYSSGKGRDASFGFFQYCAKDTLVGINDCLFREYLKKPSMLKKKMDQHNKLGKAAEKVWNEYCGLKNKSQKDIFSYYKKYYLAMREWWPLALYGEEKGEIINRRIAPIFAKKYSLSPGEAERMMAVLSHPEREMIFTKARKDFLKVCLRVGRIGFSGRSIEKHLEDYLKDCFWMKSDFYEAKEYSKTELVKEIRKELKSGPLKIREEIKKLDDGFKGIKREEKFLRKKYAFDREDEKLINFCKLVSLWMDDRKIWMMRQIYYFYSLLKDLSQELKIDYLDISFHTPGESLALIAGKKIPQEELRKRKKKVFTAQGLGFSPKFFYGKDADDLISATDSRKTNRLRGTVASRGKEDSVQGVARIIKNPKGAIFRKGEILVTSMTRVEFIPLMKKAKAIVTDEGGMACHAAIVSRELGIPAIIGTKQAMRILKDGDRIEMNMKTGEIRKI